MASPGQSLVDLSKAVIKKLTEEQNALSGVEDLMSCGEIREIYLSKAKNIADTECANLKK